MLNIRWKFFVRREPQLIGKPDRNGIRQLLDMHEVDKNTYAITNNYKTSTQLKETRMTYLILAILLIAGLAFYLTSCKSKPGSTGKQATAVQDTASPKVYHNKQNTFNDLRAIAFGMSPKDLALSLPPDKTVVYGIIMDWGIDTSTVMVVSFQTGDASLYLSTGGGVIGGGQHQNVSNASKQFVDLGQGYLDKATKTETTALPHPDEVKFYLLTNKGTFVGQDLMKNFENSASPWLPLFEAGNKVLTELRLTTEK